MDAGVLCSKVIATRWHFGVERCRPAANIWVTSYTALLHDSLLWCWPILLNHIKIHAVQLPALSFMFVIYSVCLCVLILYREFSRDVIHMISANNVRGIQIWLLWVLLWRYVPHRQHIEVHLTSERRLFRDWEYICVCENGTNDYHI
jgi:hypothetical protein